MSEHDWGVPDDEETVAAELVESDHDDAGDVVTSAPSSPAPAADDAPIVVTNVTYVLCECGCRWEGPIDDSDVVDGARVKKGHRKS